MAFNNRQTRRMLERMGVDLQPIPNVEEVVIRTSDKDMIVRKATVSEVKAKGMRIFQVMGEDVDEIVREKAKFTEEDVMLVAQQAGVSRELAEKALLESDGEPARAILKLTS